jgi:acetyl esterase
MTIPLSAGARGALAAMEARGGAPFETLAAPEARAAFDLNWPQMQDPPPLEAEEIGLPIPGGSLSALVFRGRTAPAQGARLLLYLHGGGWVVGSPRSHAAICRRLADAGEAVVVSPDYPLAPEAPFPQAPDALEACLRALPALARGLGAAAERISVAGDSAGGNLAACLALAAAANPELPALRAQLLFYPNTDARQQHASFARFATGFGLTRATMAWYRDQYVTAPGQVADPRVSPLLADLAPLASRLPRTFVALAGADILHDEGADYADRLAAAGVALDRRTWPGEIHGFLSMCRYCPAGHEAIEAAARTWRDADP